MSTFYTLTPRLFICLYALHRSILTIRLIRPLAPCDSTLGFMRIVANSFLKSTKTFDRNTGWRRKRSEEWLISFLSFTFIQSTYVWLKWMFEKLLLPNLIIKKTHTQLRLPPWFSSIYHFRKDISIALATLNCLECRDPSSLFTHISNANIEHCKKKNDNFEPKQHNFSAVIWRVFSRLWVQLYTYYTIFLKMIETKHATIEFVHTYIVCHAHMRHNRIYV